MSFEIDKNPMVSVIIPCYNAERFVRESIVSIINQSYKNLEILVCDDCSTDSTLSIIEGLANIDKRIVVIKHEENKKIVRTLNELVGKCKGKYIARMDADDISLPNRLERQVDFLENHSEISGCGCISRYINESGTVIGVSTPPISYKEAAFAAKYYSPLTHPTVVFRREVLLNNPYDPEFVHAEDYELWCRLIFFRKLKICNLGEILFKYRLSDTQISNVYSKEQAELAEKIYLKYEFAGPEFSSIHVDIFKGKRYCNYDRNVTVNYISFCANEARKNKRYTSSTAIYKALIKYCYKTKHLSLAIKLIISDLGIRSLISTYRKDRHKK